MAGNKAAAVAPTWPTINGDWIPAGLALRTHTLQNFAGNKILIHFIHRGLAYLLLLLVLIWSVKAFRIQGIPGYFRNTRWLPLALVMLQILLGILTVLLLRHCPRPMGRFRLARAIAPDRGLVILINNDRYVVPCETCQTLCNRMMRTLKAIYCFFPIQLVVLHLKKFQVLLVFWLVLFSTLNGGFMRSYGANALFLSPEYLGEVSPISTAIVGMATGIFVMSWNITTFILFSRHFRFLATTTRPS